MENENLNNEIDNDIKFEKYCERITKKTDRLEKISWMKKHDKLENFMLELTPIQNRMLNIEVEKLKIFEMLIPLEKEYADLLDKKMNLSDEIDTISKEMTSKCIHPKEQLSFNPEIDVITCKFCGTRIKFNDHI